MQTSLTARTVLALLVFSGLAACGPAPAAFKAGSGPIPVVAAENFWGSVVAQLGGSRVQVQSVITDPAADPHEYETNPADARAFAGAALVIVNGAGYDDWAQKLLAANPEPGRRVIDIARVLGRRRGDNPHFWYDPAGVATAMSAIERELTAIEPSAAYFFSAQFLRTWTAFAPYRAEVAAIRSRFQGARVGSTETIFVYLAQALGLILVSPPAFMAAVSNGIDPAVSALIQFQDQIRAKDMSALVDNVQTQSSLTAGLVAMAAARGIPVLDVTETMPAGEPTFEAWQLSQLDSLQADLVRSAAAS